MILRSAQLRDAVLEALGVPVLRTGAVLRAARRGRAQRRGRSGRQRAHERRRGRARRGGSLFVPGESVTDPVALTLALAAAAEALGARGRVRNARGRHRGRRRRARPAPAPTATGSRVPTLVVNCAGLYADEVARAAGDERFPIYPRKGEFFVFEPPDPALLEHIHLPVPRRARRVCLCSRPWTASSSRARPRTTRRTSTTGACGPAARTRSGAKAAGLVPALRDAEPIASYAGLRPAGRGVNYVIERSPVQPRLVHVAAIRSTGVSACLGIAEHVMGCSRSRGGARRGAAAAPRVAAASVRSVVAALGRLLGRRTHERHRCCSGSTSARPA